jgi:hypothetical protein
MSIGAYTPLLVCYELWSNLCIQFVIVPHVKSIMHVCLVRSIIII